MARVYIETTIPSFYFETRTSPRLIAWRQSTRVWWRDHRDRYALVTSEIVLAELRVAPRRKAGRMLELLSDVPMLPYIDGVEELAQYYLDQKLMPRTAAPDAYHVALASLHEIEFVLTWNIKHLANANKVTHLQVLNARRGLPAPTITTPDLLVPETPR